MEPFWPRSVIRTSMFDSGLMRSMKRRTAPYLECAGPFDLELCQPVCETNAAKPGPKSHYHFMPPRTRCFRWPWSIISGRSFGDWHKPTSPDVAQILILQPVEANWFFHLGSTLSLRGTDTSNPMETCFWTLGNLECGGLPDAQIASPKRHQIGGKQADFTRNEEDIGGQQCLRK